MNIYKKTSVSFLLLILFFSTVVYFSLEEFVADIFVFWIMLIIWHYFCSCYTNQRVWEIKKKDLESMLAGSVFFIIFFNVVFMLLK